MLTFIRWSCCVLFLFVKWTKFLLVKLILFKELVAYGFLFVKLVASWFFFSLWYFYLDFSAWETDFVCETWCLLIFCLRNVLHVYFWSWNLLHHDFSSWNLYNYFSPRETDFVDGICCVMTFVHETWWMLIFVHKLIASWFFFSWNFYYFLIFLIFWFYWFFCSLNWFSYGTCC